ncbi:AI-2E family transporter [Entamoeba marina]
MNPSSLAKSSQYDNNKTRITNMSIEYLTVIMFILIILYVLFLDYQMIGLYSQAFFWAIFCCLVLSYPYDILLKTIKYCDKVIYPSSWLIRLLIIIIGLLPFSFMIITSSFSFLAMLPFLFIIVFLYVPRPTLTATLLIMFFLVMFALIITVVVRQSIREMLQLINSVIPLINQLSYETIQNYFKEFQESYIGSMIYEYSEVVGLTDYFKIETIKTTLIESMKSLGEWIKPYSFISIVTTVSDNIFGVFTFLYSLFYFLIYKKQINEHIYLLLPFDHDGNKILRDGLVNTSVRLAFVNVVLFLLHSILTFVTFNIAGLPYKTVCSIISGLLIVLPALSNMLVWIPAGVVLLLQGNTSTMIWFVSIHSFAYFIVDSWIYSFIPGVAPYFIGLSIGFGVYAFGISGWIIGPLVFVTTFTLKDLYVHHFQSLNTINKVKAD